MPLEGDVTLIDVPTWLDLLTIVVAVLGGALFASRRAPMAQSLAPVLVKPVAVVRRVARPEGRGGDAGTE